MDHYQNFVFLEIVIQLFILVIKRKKKTKICDIYFYSGVLSNIDNIQEWFSEVRERLTRNLDDKSFEHDTQASTGSTTGDWFILL